MYARNLYLSFGTTPIYQDAEFNIGPRDKCGIVGVNGAGKTTLFRLITNEISPDAGTINIDNANIGYLPQQIKFDNTDITVWDFLMSGRPIDKLQEKLNDLYNRLATTPDDENIADEISLTQERLEYYDVYNAEDQLLEIISNMDIDSDILDMKLQNLSGGQKSKVAFARLLYSMADILLLDEPTNHLDIKTKDWITEFLRKYRGNVLIISHDTEFLNKIVNKILYIDKTTHKISVFDGNYDDYMRKSAALRHARNVKIAAEERQIKSLSDFVARANAASPTNHSIKRVGHVRAKTLEKILANRTLREQTYKKVKINLTPRTPGARHPITVDDLWFRFPGNKLLYRKLSFYITGGERFLIVGENGTGKSTLLKLIMGMLPPERGEITINPKTDIAYYAQELELLDKNKTILENVATDDYTELQLRSVLANFLFYDTDVFKKISVLSPGEQARVALCKMLLRRANMLILDEPTNHLDPDTQRIIGDNFRDFDGTIIAVSHNPDFVEQIGITRMLILPDGRICDYDHDLMEYFYNLNSDKD
ncbi:MAG: ATP-binding cassette domain-containing protein [Alphaproteobacteria bacterium]|nr:ATP-binding cassette domain-containing protein [Alphaproteobacteria bacterium]